MADKTKIEWTDSTWQIITGCSVVSPGCTNCYAMRLAGTRLRNHPSRTGLTRDTKAGPVWTGEVRFNEQWLNQPLRWRRPRMIFVCAHGDLFAEGVEDAWLDRIFAVMALCPQHTFQVLTKRPERMREYLTFARTHLGSEVLGTYEHIYNAMWSLGREGLTEPHPYRFTYPYGMPWPLPNVWLGVSCEDQRRADERVPILLDTQAAIRWVSAEPLLGPIDWENFCDGFKFIDALRGNWWHDDPEGHGAIARGKPKLDWIVAGGESGTNARPMHPDWVRRTRDDCAAAGVAFNFKQWGAWLPIDHCPKIVHGAHAVVGIDGRFVANTDIAHPPERMFTVNVGKKAAGRLIDGVEHNGFPEVAA